VILILAAALVVAILLGAVLAVGVMLLFAVPKF
jgi:hypothetical protein